MTLVKLGSGSTFIFLRLLLSLSILVGLGIADNDTECKLKEQWQGSWFQNGFPYFLVEIQEKSFILDVPEAITIDTSGRHHFPGECVSKHDEDHYVFYNPEGPHGACTACVRIIGLHQNAIRYTKSDCMEALDRETTLEILCDSIGHSSEDLSLGPHYLFRHNAPSVNCPFQPEDHFQMNYTKIRDKNTQSCSHDLSTAQTCFNGTDMLINYEACIDNVSAKKEKLSCIAVWKDGVRNFFVANVILGENSPTKWRPLGYRCFVFQNTSNNESLKFEGTVSEEGTCNGLSDIGTGETKYRFYKSESCDFPRWFSSKEWHGLDHGMTFTNRLHQNTPKRLVYSEMFKKTYHPASSESPGSVQKLSCIWKVNHTNGENKTSVTIVTRISTPGCEFKVMCVTLTRLTEDITLYETWLQSDRITYENFYKTCLKSPENFDKQEFSYEEQTLISKTGKNTDCPYPGVYKTSHVYKSEGYTSETQSLCNSTKFMPKTIEIGCSNSKQITILHDNDNSCGIGLDKTSKCYGSWIRQGTEYLVINDPYHDLTVNKQEPKFLCIEILKDASNGPIILDGQLGSCGNSLRWTVASENNTKYLRIGVNQSESCGHEEKSDSEETSSNRNESQDNKASLSSSGQRVFASILVIVFLALPNWLPFFYLED